MYNVPFLILSSPLFSMKKNELPLVKMGSNFMFNNFHYTKHIAMK